MTSEIDVPVEQASEKPHCPKCDSNLSIKSSSKGPFWACDGFPQCDYTRPLSKSNNEVQVVKILDDVCCPECESDLAVKTGKFGMFIGCTSYPECTFIVKEQDDEDYEPVSCPDCEPGVLHQKSGKKGKAFYACDQYPSCKYLLNDRPLNEACPKCGSALLALDKNNQKYCVMKNCDYSSADEQD